jgi:DNA repair protein RecO (recombination protein O)
MSVKATATSDSGFVLHSYPYSETSLLTHLWTANHGRIVVVAKGARRPNSALRTLVAPFQPLALSWAGRGEVKTLRSADNIRVVTQLSGQALFAAFYLNELLLKLTTREDPHEAIFELYETVINGLAASCLPHQSMPVSALEPVLRAFEFALLGELGYGVAFTEVCTSGATVERGRTYWLVADRGIFPHDPNIENVIISGDALWDIANNQYDNPKTSAPIKRAARLLIAHHLGFATLHSKSLFTERRVRDPLMNTASSLVDAPFLGEPNSSTFD